MEIGKNKKFVSKVLATVIALAFLLPLGLMITVGENPGEPVAKQAPITDDFYIENPNIRLSEASFDINQGPQGLPSELMIEKYGSQVDGWYIVQFNNAIDPTWTPRLRQLGAEIGDYVPHNAFMVKMSHETKAKVENLDFVQYVGIYQPAFKIPSPLVKEIPLQRNLFSEDALAFIKWENLFDKAKVIGEGTETMEVTVQVHEGENPHNVAALISKAGGRLIGTSKTSGTVRAEVSMAGLQTLAFVNNVEYIQPYYMPEIHLSEADFYEQSLTATQTPAWDAGIHGESVIVATSDTGIDTDHVQFRDPAWPGADDWTGASPSHRKVIRYEQWADNAYDEGTSQHGTHTAAYACGDGAYVGNGDDDRYGIAYAAKISFADIGANDDSLSGIPQDLKDMFQIQYDDGARLASNSWGVSVTSAGSRTWTEGTYSEDSANADWFMWNNPDFLVFFSAGNNRSTNPRPVNDPTAPDFNSTVTPPATGKNMVCVGAHSSATSWQSMEGYSSWGPTRSAAWSCTDGEGRLKPDIASDGNVQSAHGDRNRNGAEDANYQGMTGTSTSGPVAMGGAALIHQYFKDGYYPVSASSPVPANGFIPSAALVKAALINGARDATSGTGTNVHDYNLNGHTMDYPNNDQGWGMVCVGDSLFFNNEYGGREMEVDDNTEGLLTGGYREYQIYVEDASNPLEITLAWTDFKGTQATCGALVNDLELTVTSPGGANTYYGNNYGSSSRQSDPTNPAGRDHVNNVECVLLKSPSLTQGWYTINITATNIAVGPQPYALVMTGDFDETVGWVKMDKSVYSEGDSIFVEVKDWDAGAPVPATLVSSTGDVETLSLPQLGVDRFNNSASPVTTNLMDPVKEDGMISIENNGWIIAYYNDTAGSNPPGDYTSTAIATTDVTGPGISMVFVTDITNSAALVHWTTDVPATSQVYYGTTGALGSQSTLDTDLVFKHSVILTGLNAFTNYFFDVESQSIGGVTTRDTNGGDHYMFTTVDNPDVLIVQEHSDLESSDQQVADWRLSLNEYGWSFVVWETVKYGLPSVAALNTAKCVYWDVGEGYPQLGPDERAIIQTWVNQAGQQLWYQTGQDVCWDMSDDGDDGPGTEVDNAWRQTYLHTNYERDDADGGGGDEGSPFRIRSTAHQISDSALGGNPVDQDLEGDIYGSGRFWPDDLMNNLDGDTPPPWDYNRHAGGGNAGGISWTGASYKLAFEAFAHAMIQDDGTYGTPGNVFGVDLNPERAIIADETLIWLFGIDHPDVHVTNPDGGETFSGTESITWTIANANTIDIQISRDGGQSYVVEATGLPGTQTSYNWNTATSGTYGPGLDFPNGDFYRVKVIGYGTTLTGFDVSDDNFTVQNGGGDDLGPVIWAGSVKPDPIPVIKGDPLHITAIADDRYKGNSNIAQVEYYVDGMTGGFLVGNMDASDAAFDEALEDVDIDYDTGSGVPADLTLGTHTIYVRARDSYSNWGGFESIEFTVIAGPESPPTVDLTAPDGGELWVGGTAEDIIWDMADNQNPNNLLSVDLEYSLNGVGGPWIPIATGLTGFGANPCIYSWDPIDMVDSTQARIRITVEDLALTTDQDISAADFTFDSTAPAAATNVRAELDGTGVRIYWDASVSGDVDYYRVYWAMNNWDGTGDAYASYLSPGLNTDILHANVGINNPSSYVYQVRTYDLAGHETRTTTQAAKYGSTQAVLAREPDWFALGSPLVQSDTTISHVIKGFLLPANMDYLRTYDADTGVWSSYNPAAPASANTLTDINTNDGLWMHVTDNVRFATAGYVEDKAIPMYTGWNFVAYPFAARSMTTADIITHLTANCPNYDAMMIEDLSTPAPYHIKTPAGTETVLHNMGFWVHVTGDTTWTVLNY